MANQWQVKRLAGALGAEVTNVDLTIATEADIKQVNIVAGTQSAVLSWADQAPSSMWHSDIILVNWKITLI